MHNHIYMIYDDSTPESTRDADITHKVLARQGLSGDPQGRRLYNLTL